MSPPVPVPVHGPKRVKFMMPEPKAFSPVKIPLVVKTPIAAAVPVAPTPERKEEAPRLLTYTPRDSTSLPKTLSRIVVQRVLGSEVVIWSLVPSMKDAKGRDVLKDTRRFKFYRAGRDGNTGYAYGYVGALTIRRASSGNDFQWTSSTITNAKCVVYGCRPNIDFPQGFLYALQIQDVHKNEIKTISFDPDAWFCEDDCDYNARGSLSMAYDDAFFTKKFPHWPRVVNHASMAREKLETTRLSIGGVLKPDDVHTIVMRGKRVNVIMGIVVDVDDDVDVDDHDCDDATLKKFRDLVPAWMRYKETLTPFWSLS